jgi:hypothetical protein
MARVSKSDGLAELWEQRGVIRQRFRKEISWLQWPIPTKDPTKDPESADDPHTPTTRALELNVDALDCMLSHYKCEFVEVHALQKEARETYLCNGF